MAGNEVATLAIDVISDVVCPWCYIGKRRLEEALARVAANGVRAGVRWLPFELNPDLPPEGIDRGTYLDRKFGRRDTGAIYARVRAAGETAGIAFDFERIARQPNTRAAHRLVEWVQEQGHDASLLMERLFAAYFLQGRSLVGAAALADIAAEAGIDHAAAQEVLESDYAHAAVAEAERRAHAVGVTGVPFFIFGRRLAVSGAQAVDLLVEAISRATEESPA